MRQNFGRSRFPGWSRMGLIVQLAVMAAALLLVTSCSFIESREVTISPASAAEKESYYQDEAFSREGLSFESESCCFISVKIRRTRSESPEILQGRSGAGD